MTVEGSFAIVWWEPVPIYAAGCRLRCADMIYEVRVVAGQLQLEMKHVKLASGVCKATYSESIAPLLFHISAFPQQLTETLTHLFRIHRKVSGSTSPYPSSGTVFLQRAKTA